MSRIISGFQNSGIPCTKKKGGEGGNIVRGLVFFF